MFKDGILIEKTKGLYMCTQKLALIQVSRHNRVNPTCPDHQANGTGPDHDREMRTCRVALTPDMKAHGSWSVFAACLTGRVLFFSEMFFFLVYSGVIWALKNALCNMRGDMSRCEKYMAEHECCSDEDCTVGSCSCQDNHCPHLVCQVKARESAVVKDHCLLCTFCTCVCLKTTTLWQLQHRQRLCLQRTQKNQKYAILNEPRIFILHHIHHRTSSSRKMYLSWPSPVPQQIWRACTCLRMCMFAEFSPSVEGCPSNEEELVNLSKRSKNTIIRPQRVVGDRLGNFVLCTFRF